VNLVVLCTSATPYPSSPRPFVDMFTCFALPWAHQLGGYNRGHVRVIMPIRLCPVACKIHIRNVGIDKEIQELFRNLQFCRHLSVSSSWKTLQSRCTLLVVGSIKVSHPIWAQVMMVFRSDSGDLHSSCSTRLRWG
jgi:hypothetical protein